MMIVTREHTTPGAEWIVVSNVGRRNECINAVLHSSTVERFLFSVTAEQAKAIAAELLECADITIASSE